MSKNSPSIRITYNHPCKNCSEVNIRKHCFSCGRCGIKFIYEITYNGIEYGICSRKCDDNYVRTREFTKYKYYGLKDW